MLKLNKDGIKGLNKSEIDDKDVYKNIKKAIEPKVDTKNVNDEDVVRDIIANDAELAKENHYVIKMLYNGLLRYYPGLASRKEDLVKFLKIAISRTNIPDYSVETWEAIEEQLKDRKSKYGYNILELIIDDQILSKEDPLILIELYKTMEDMDSELIKKEEVMRSILRAAIQTEAIDDYDKTAWLGMEKARRELENNEVISGWQSWMNDTFFSK